MNRNSLRTDLRLLMLGVVLGFVIADQRHPFPRFWHHWAWVGLGGSFALVTMLDVKDGTTTLVRSAVERATDPTGFWTAIIINGVIGVGVTLGAAGALMKLWEF